jgi:hypothetical protein
MWLKEYKEHNVVLGQQVHPHVGRTPDGRKLILAWINLTNYLKTIQK